MSRTTLALPRLVAILALGALAVATGGCFLLGDDAADDDDDTPTECTSNAECVNGEVCAANRCVAEGSIGLGGSCSANRDCATGLFCSPNRPVAMPWRANACSCSTNTAS